MNLLIAFNASVLWMSQMLFGGCAFTPYDCLYSVNLALEQVRLMRQLGEQADL